MRTNVVEKEAAADQRHRTGVFERVTPVKAKGCISIGNIIKSLFAFL